MKTSNHFCRNHPLVAAIDSCVTCDKHLCGLCANFADSAVYCEACFKNYEAESLVKSKKAENERAEFKKFQGDKEEIIFTPPTKSKVNFRLVRIGLYCLFTVATAWGLYSYNQPSNIPRNPATVQLERSQGELIECLAIFAEIGQQLFNGSGPTIDLRCGDTTLSNRVQREEDELRIVHPNPAFYGTKAIYVTDKNPIPVVVPIDN